MTLSTPQIPAASRVRHSLNAWLAPFLTLLVLLAAGGSATATHIRAGDIQASVDTTNLLRYNFVMKLYTDDRSALDQTEVKICFGGTTFRTIQRESKVPLPGCLRVSLNTYRFSFIFAAPGTYTVSFIGNNRNGNIVNLGNNPIDLSFYIETRILIDASLGPNATPSFTQPPIQEGAVGRRFEHTPATNNPSNRREPLDSLSFQVDDPLQGQLGGAECAGSAPIPGYTSPLVYTTPGGTYGMDPITGVITWNAPASPGEYNIAYYVYEYRKLGPGVFIEISRTRRDMQITITGSNNRPPTLQLPADTCVVANTTLTKIIRATDPDGHDLTLAGFGGPLFSSPAATLTPVAGGPTGTAAATFSWTPDCSSVANQPYLTTLSAEDTPPNCGTRLSSNRVWQIRVVGPPPQNLRPITSSFRQVDLQWDPYVCGSTADSIRVYRREGDSPYQPGPCETGVPASSGYVYIGSVAATATAFADRNNGRRFKRGSTYCYLIYATWPVPRGGASLASQKACTVIPGLLPVLTNVTVDATDPAAGAVTVKWTQGNFGVLATIYTEYYRLARATRDAPTAFTVVADRIAPTDTTFIDRNLDTEGQQPIYRLESVLALLDGVTEVEIDTVQTATSPRLEGRRNGAQIELTWTYDVPWDNTTRLHYIYRRVGGTFTLIDSVQATATGGAYTDRFTFRGISISQENPNCYRILTRGTYVVGTRQPAVTQNFSQERCVRNEPCPPVLALAPPDCAAEAATCPTTFSNVLTWTPDAGPACATDLVSWRVYFRPGATGDFTLLATVPVAQLTYTHADLQTRLGCYTITAVTESGIESAQSNIVCQDNCELFTLPNIITPNLDGRNDTFVPLCASPVRRVAFTVYNRWGVKVYEGDQNPRIEWNGTGSGGRRLADGTYFYRAEVEFDVLNPTPRFFKGWVELAGSSVGPVN